MSALAGKALHTIGSAAHAATGAVGSLVRQESGVVARREHVMGKCVFTELEPFRVPPADHPFDEDYDANHALWLVSAACLIYADEDEVRKVATGMWGMPSVTFFDDEVTDTQAFGMANDDFIVIGFRGTESKEDWKTNMKYAHVKISELERYAKIDIHQGFSRACLSVLPQVEQFIADNGKAQNPGKPLYICGHSLGGALATLCYGYLTLRDEPVTVNGVVTIGQPRVGNRRFVQAMKEEGPCLLQRIYNSNDVVPTVPPRGKGYRHYGNPIYFTAKGKLVRRPAGVVTKLDKTKSWATFDSGIAAHMKDLYLNKVVEYHALTKKKQASGAVAKAAITMVSASNVKVADKGGASDPYCVLRYHDIKHKTEVQKKTLDPEWNHEVSLPEVHEHEKLIFEVWDWDSGRNADDFLGQVVLTLDEFESGEHIFELQPRCGKKDRHIRGTLTIRTDYHILREAAHVAHAKVHVKLHGARSLKAADKGGVSDPYALVQCNGLQKKTSVVKKTLNPDWDFEFDVPGVAGGDSCTVDVYDWDRGSKDDFLGRAVLDFDESFVDAENVQLELRPRPGKSDKNISGHVLASFRFSPQESDGLRIGRATITVHSASNVKAADRGGTSDPYVIMLVGHDKDAAKHKTEVVKKTLNPVWEHQFELPKLKANTEIRFQVYDWDRVGSDDFIGEAYVKFGALYNLERESWTLAGREGKNDRNISGELVLSFKFEPLDGTEEQCTAASSSSSSSSAAE